MKKIVIICLLISISCCFIVPRLGNPDPVPPKVFKLQLNDPPEERWRHIIPEFIPRAQRFVYLITQWLPIPTIVYDAVALWGENVFPYKDIVLEIKGMAKMAGLPFPQVFFLQFFYEWSKWRQCSSVILRDSNNQIQHGRNWDFPLFVFFSRLSATVEYYRGDQYLFTVEQVIGSSLVLTAIKNGEYAITINARGDTNLSFKDILVNLFVKNYIPPDFFLRIVFEQAPNFDAALKMLKEQPIATAVYYIISGKSDNEGAVIERDAESVHGFYQLNETNWFLVQTNYDRNVPDPIHDPRRIPAEKRLEKIGQGITISQLQQQIMFKWPTFNLATILTFMAIPSTSYRNTSLWWGRNGGPLHLQYGLKEWEKGLVVDQQ